MKIDAALVIGNYRATLAVVRSLARAGCTVILGVNGKRHGNDRSRYVSELWRHPDFDTEEGAFADALQSLLDTRPEIRLIMPVTEQATMHFARTRYRLAAHVAIATARQELVEFCQDKEKIATLAASVGIPVAPYRVVTGLDGLRLAGTEVGFPCVVRPTQPPARLLGRKAVIFHSARDLRSKLAQWPSDSPRLLVQQYVEGFRHNLYFVAQEGKIAACAQVKVVRTDRIDGTGLAVEGVTVALDERLKSHCAILARELKYTGVGCAQFLVKRNANDISFIEINPRLGANCEIVQRCGIDLVRCMSLLALGRSLDSAQLPAGYPVGYRYAWLYGDLAGLWHELRRRRIGPADAMSWSARLLRNAVLADVHLTFRWSDPMPTLTNFLRNLLPR